MTPSTSAPEVGNTCIICLNGANVGGIFAPYADGGDLRTCADLIDEAKLYEIGSNNCGWFEFQELDCCYNKPENLCYICPDGATAGDDYVPEYYGNTFTCYDLIEGAKRFESGSDACGLYDLDMLYCFPPEGDNTYIICPDGPAIGDFAPIDGDSGHVRISLRRPSCMELVPRIAHFLKSRRFFVATTNLRICALFARTVPLPAMIMSQNMKGVVVSHVHNSSRFPKILNLGPVHADIMT
jgi:hypothetical protein